VKNTREIDGDSKISWMFLLAVERDVNSKLHKLIGEFYNLSEHPVLLNTSFNVNCTSLVESPADAIDCFYLCGIDVLVLGDFMLVKQLAILESVKGGLQ
jgi:predicted NodU family carbamoyl transferase